MKNILEEIWYCNIGHQLDATMGNKEVKNLLNLAVQNREKLPKTYLRKFYGDPMFQGIAICLDT